MKTDSHPYLLPFNTRYVYMEWILEFEVLNLQNRSSYSYLNF